MPYQVRFTNVLAAREQLLPIWAANLPVRGELDAKLRWFYCDGPHGPGQTLLLESPRPAQAAVGAAGVGVRTLSYRGRTLRAALFADLAIDRAHRCGFPALSLVRAAKQHAEDSFDLGYGMPNATAALVYRRAGYNELGIRSRYVRLLRTHAHLARRFDNGIVVRGLARVIDATVRAVGRARAMPLRRRATLQWLDRFDPRFDALWERAQGLAPVLCERSSAFLNWRFMQHPADCYRIAAVIDTASERLRAYGVVRDRAGVAELADAFGAGRSDLDALLTLLVPDLTSRGFRSVSFDLMAASWVHELLTLHGFVARPNMRVISLVIGNTMRDVHELTDPSAWYLTDLDED